MTLGKSINKLRTNANMSQEQFADLFGVSQQSVQKWETDAATPELSKLVSIAKYFGVSLDALILGNGNRIVEELKSTKEIKPQYQNIEDTLGALEAAKEIGCKRFVCTGSQAEYGPHQDLITEETCPHPIDAYGSAKLAACILTRQRAMDLGIEWIWGRIFSLYGKYEPTGRMLPELVASLQAGKDFYMQSDGQQNWDYLNVIDGAEALIALGEKGKNGEIYNIASGKHKPLKEFIEDIQKVINSEAKVHYTEGKKALFSLQVDVSRIANDTGWKVN